MKEKVILITVTYNSSNLLERLIYSALLQTYSLYKIIIVDNNSDGKHRDKIEQLSSLDEKIEIVSSGRNLGGAGGFKKGMQYAYDKYPEFDWIWIMDDDAFPREECLEKLLVHSLLENVGCLTPMVFGVELQAFQFYQHKFISKNLAYDVVVGTNLDDFKDVTPIESNAFVGPLIKKKVVTDIGVPDGQLFIYGDDLEYIYRISRKYNVYLIKDAIINHRDVVVESGMRSVKGFWKNYYMYRNRLLFIEKYKSNNRRGIEGKLVVIKNVVIEEAKILFKDKYKKNKILCSLCLLQGLRDGLLNKKGKIIDPVWFNSKLKGS